LQSPQDEREKKDQQERDYFVAGQSRGQRVKQSFLQTPKKKSKPADIPSKIDLGEGSSRAVGKKFFVMLSRKKGKKKTSTEVLLKCRGKKTQSNKEAEEPKRCQLKRLCN